MQGEERDGSGEPTDTELLAKLSDDYAEYMTINVTDEKEKLESNIEDMLTRLEDYCGFIDMIRNDSSHCLGTRLPDLLVRCREMEQMFQRIDQLEAFVAMVKSNVDLIEEAVNQAENDMGSFSSVRKLISSISFPGFLSKKSATKQQTRQKPKFIPPDVFQTNRYLIPDQPADGLSSAFSSAKQSDEPPVEDSDSHKVTS